MSNMSETAIKLQNVSKNFGPHQILRNINLEIKKGEIYGIIGISGSGKSTLLNLITNIIPQNEGTIRYHIDKKDKFYQISENPEEIKFYKERLIHYFEENNINSKLSSKNLSNS